MVWLMSMENVYHKLQPKKLQLVLRLSLYLTQTVLTQTQQKLQMAHANANSDIRRSKYSTITNAAQYASPCNITMANPA